MKQESLDAGFSAEFEAWWSVEKLNYKFPSSSYEQSCYVCAGNAWKAAHANKTN